MRGLLQAIHAAKYWGQPLTVDPAGCRCTPCIVWDSVPADLLTEKQKEQVADDYKVTDRTGYSEYEWERWLA